MQKAFIIAIDGPVASGKGTIAPRLAKLLNGFYLYTGAIYRSLAFYCMQHNIPVDQEHSVILALPDIHLELENDHVLLNGVNVTEAIKAPEVAKNSSPVSVYPMVREYFVNLQRNIAHKMIERGEIVVAEGRDTGTIIFPNAEVKIYLTATPETRAQRRLEQYQEKGQTMDFKQILEDTNERDTRDMNRKTAPLAQRPEEFGYFVLDNSHLSEEETLNAIIGELKKRDLVS